LFGSRADQKARLIDEIYHWKVECITEINEAHHLVAAVAIQSSAAAMGVVGDQAYGIAVESGQSCHEGTAEISPYFKERVSIDYQANQSSNVVPLFAVSGYY
jgi:hypothetical protein